MSENGIDLTPNLCFVDRQTARKNTGLLLTYFGEANQGEPIEIKEGMVLDEKVVTAAIRQGMKKGKIRIKWMGSENMPSKEPIISTTEIKGEPCVRVVLSESLLVDIASDSQKTQNSFVDAQAATEGKIMKAWRRLSGSKPSSSLEPLPEDAAVKNRKLVSELIKDIYTRYFEL